MARPTKDFSLAWTALSEHSEAKGLRAIPLSSAGPCRLFAGRRFPENVEALLVGFQSASASMQEQLPQGFGFNVSREDPFRDGYVWMALTRTTSGSVELFTDMVADVAGTMDAAAHLGEHQLLRTFLGRIRSWQEFMKRGDPSLTPESELGLLGELVLLGDLLEAGVGPAVAVAGWVGPLGAPQDFVFGTGAIEVKATLARQGFQARIPSLEQLDDSLRKPLFVAALRLSINALGESLPDCAARVRGGLIGDDWALHTFDDRLLCAGFHATRSSSYQRKFLLSDIRILEVTDFTPRLTCRSVPPGVTNVRYEIDLDALDGSALGLPTVLLTLGAN